jgi:tRNA(Arg) A34 adenosine deaminase TadA
VITKRDIYFIYKAIEIAKKKDSQGRVKICSFITKGNRIITPPRINNYRKSFRGNVIIENSSIGYHSEIRTIKNYLLKKSIKGCTLYVAGATINGNIIISSQPCSHCMNWINKSNIKRVVYITRTSNELSIKELII